MVKNRQIHHAVASILKPQRAAGSIDLEFLQVSCGGNSLSASRASDCRPHSLRVDSERRRCQKCRICVKARRLCSVRVCSPPAACRHLAHRCIVLRNLPSGQGDDDESWAEEEIQTEPHEDAMLADYQEWSSST